LGKTIEEAKWLKWFRYQGMIENKDSKKIRASEEGRERRFKKERVHFSSVWDIKEGTKKVHMK
jgi:hypothetical protein